jgi:hypothetical protein
LSNVSAEISKAKNQRSLGKVLSSLNKTGSDTGRGQAEDRQRTGRGQARLINISNLEDEEDRQRTGRGQAAIQAEDRQRYTTIERETDITTTPLPPAGGSERGKGEKGGGDQPAQQPIVVDLPKQTGKKKRVKLIDEGVVFFRSLRPEWVTEAQWEEIICWRVRKKVAMTERAADGLIREMLKSRKRGYTVDQILDLLSQKTWSSYMDRYLDGQQMQPAAPKQPVHQDGAAPCRVMPDSRKLAERMAQERYEEDMRRERLKNEQEGG